MWSEPVGLITFLLILATFILVLLHVVGSV